MNYLLDTHTFLWFINGDQQLSQKAKKAISNTDTTKFISIASFWEIAIKVNTGKLELDMPFQELKLHLYQNGFELLPITIEHTAMLCDLEIIHRDPFDRIIIAQAIADNLTLISKDGNFSSYKLLQLLW